MSLIFNFHDEFLSPKIFEIDQFELLSLIIYQFVATIFEAIIFEMDQFEATIFDENLIFEKIWRVLSENTGNNRDPEIKKLIKNHKIS